MSSTFGGGGRGEIKYVVSVDTTQAIQQLQGIGQQFQTIGQTGGQSAQQLGQLPQALDQVTTSTGKFSQANADMAAELQATDIQAKEATRSTQSFGQTLRSNITSILQVGTGILGLVSNYTSLQRTQLSINKLQITEQNQRRLLEVLTRKHTEAVQKYGAASQEAHDIQAKIDILQGRNINTVEQLSLRQEQLNQSMLGFGFSLVQTGLGIAQAVSGFKSFRIAQDAATVSTNRFGTAALLTWGKVLAPIALVVGAIELAKHNIFGLGEVFTDIRARVEAAIPGLKGFFDMLVQIGESVSAIVEGRFGDLQKIWKGTPQVANAATDSLGNLGEAVGIVGKEANKAQQEYGEFLETAVQGIVKISQGTKGEKRDWMKLVGIKGDEKKKVREALDAIEDGIDEMEQAGAKIEALEGFSILEKFGFEIDPDVLEDIRNTLDSDLRDILPGKDKFDELAEIVEKNSKASQPEFNKAIATFFQANPGLLQALQQIDPKMAAAIGGMIDSVQTETQTAVDGLEPVPINPNQIIDDKPIKPPIGAGNPFQGMIDTIVGQIAAADYSKIPTTLGDRIKSEFVKKPIKIEDFVTGAGGKVPKGAPGAAIGGEGFKAWLVEKVDVPFGKAWDAAKIRIEAMMTAHPIVDKLAKGDIFGATTDASINSVNILQAIWENVAVPFIEKWGETATYVDTYMLSKPLITKIAKLDILGDAVKGTMKLDKWFLEDIATPVGKAWIDAVQVPVQAYIKLENIFKDIKVEDIMGTISDAAGGFVKWMTEKVYNPLKDAWDATVGKVIDLLTGQKASGAGDEGFPGAGFDFDTTGKQKWTPPHGANKISGTSAAEIDRMLNQADSDHPWNGTDEWGRVWKDGSQFDTRGRLPPNRFDLFDYKGPERYYYGTPQDQKRAGELGQGFAIDYSNTLFGGLFGNKGPSKEEINQDYRHDKVIGTRQKGPNGKYYVWTTNGWKEDIGGSSFGHALNEAGRFFGLSGGGGGVGDIPNEPDWGGGSPLAGTNFNQLRIGYNPMAFSSQGQRAYRDPLQSITNTSGTQGGTFGGIGGTQFPGATKPASGDPTGMFADINKAFNQLQSNMAGTINKISDDFDTLMAFFVKEAKAGFAAVNKQFNTLQSNIAGTENTMGSDFDTLAAFLVKEAKAGFAFINKQFNQLQSNLAGTMNTIGDDFDTVAAFLVKESKAAFAAINKQFNRLQSNMAGTMNTMADDWDTIMAFMVKEAKAAASSINSTLASIKNRTVTVTTVHRNVNQNIQRFQHGGEFTTHGPQVIMVGDNPSGQEHVRITPLGGTARQFGRSGGAGHGAGNDIILNAVFQINGNNIINDMKLSKKVKMTVGENRDKFV